MSTVTRVDSYLLHEFRWIPDQYTKRLPHKRGKHVYRDSNGQESWWYGNKLHRLDGPALKLLHGNEQWFKNGKRHRVDGPAITNHHTEMWYLDDVVHRNPKYGPAITFKDDNLHDASKYRLNPRKLKFYETDYSSNGKEFYISHGLLHNPNGPAVVGNHTTVHYINGVIQSPVEKSGEVRPALRQRGNVKIWYENDKIHRENGPAYVTSDVQIWYNHGRVHRDESEGPAILFTGAIKMHRTITGIIENNQQVDCPYWLLPYNELISRVWNVGDRIWVTGGKLHRNNGCAIESKVSHIYARNGLYHRDEVDSDGHSLPAIEMPQCEIWCKDGTITRDPAEGPAYYGKGNFSIFFENGKCVEIVSSKMIADEIQMGIKGWDI